MRPIDFMSRATAAMTDAVEYVTPMRITASVAMRPTAYTSHVIAVMTVEDELLILTVIIAYVETRPIGSMSRATVATMAVGE